MNTNNKMGTSYISEQRSMNGITFPTFAMHNPAFSCHDTHPDCSSTWHEMVPHPLKLNLGSELWDGSLNFSGPRPPQHFYSSGSRASSSPCSGSFQHPYVIAGISLTGHEALQSSKMLREMQPNHNTVEQMLSNRKLCATNNVLEHSSNPWNRATATHTSEQTDGVTTHKQRIRWTAELHEQFVEAVNCLGGPKKATPKGILRIMRAAGLTIFHIKSHLQKYRMVKKIPSHIEGKRVKINNYDGMKKTPSNPNMNGRTQLAEALHFQMEIQKKLNENLELQRYFQKRVEEQQGYPVRVYDEQKRMQALYQNQYLSNVVVPNTADSVLGGNKENNGT